MQNYTNKLVEFLNGANTVIISGEKDFISFKSWCKKVGLTCPWSNYDSLFNLARFNGCTINHDTVLVEYQPYKGFTFGYNSFEESEKWYGMKPWTVQEVNQSLR